MGKKVLNNIENETLDIFRRFKNRDFSGNTGRAIKNSTWQLATLVIAKFGSLLFTIILARILMPELFGLYGLAIATILFLGGFSEIGINTTLLTFLSKHIDSNKKKAKAYFIYFSKFKLLFLLFGTGIILLFANYFAKMYYQKPIYLGLLAGMLYFPLTSIYKYIGIIFFSRNNFRVHFFGEIFYQILRIVIVSALSVYLISKETSQALFIFYLIIASSFCFFVTGIYFLIAFFRKNPFKKTTSTHLTAKEKQEVWMFTLPLTFTIFSGIFFNYIDTIMLGRFVDAAYIGYYRAAFTLIAAAAAVVSFSAVPLMPIFSRLKGEKLRRGFKKSRDITLLLSIIALLFTFIVAKYIIVIVYGNAYLTSVIILQLFSLLLISIPLTSLYETYYTSQRKTKVFSLLLFITTVLNIILNILFINIGLEYYDMLGAVLGACIATIISRYVYLFFLVVYKRRIEKQTK